MVCARYAASLIFVLCCCAGSAHGHGSGVHDRRSPLGVARCDVRGHYSCTVAVDSGVGAPKGGLARGVAARFGSIDPSLTLTPPGIAAFAFTQATGATTANSRKCPRCPEVSPGVPVFHPNDLRCDVVCLCTTCNSDRHLVHGCFITHGVPKEVKMKAEMAAEITQLHALHLAGEFDWRLTTTSLSWLGRKQATQASGIPSCTHC